MVLGLAAAHDGDEGAAPELAHRARMHRQHAVEQPTICVRQGDAEEGAQAGGAERERRLSSCVPRLAA